MTIKQFSSVFHHQIRSRVVVRMKLFGIFLVVLLVQVAGESARKAKDDINLACIIRFLQIRGKLEESFHTTPAPGNLCRILLPLIYANHSERLCLRLWETKTVRAECVFEKLKKSNFIDLELKFEIYSESKHLGRNLKKKRLYESSSQQREVLINAAKVCRSDPTYGGLFDEILGINSSLIVLQENYCLLRYVLENKFLAVPRVSLNPKNIPTSSIECKAIVMKRQNENEQKLLEAFQRRKYSAEAVECLLELYHDEKIFGWNLAKDLLYKLNPVESLRRAEDWRISKTLSDFNRKSSNCLYSFNWSLF